MSQKNNLSFNNLGCQISTYKLYNLNYNLDYIVYKLKQKEDNYIRSAVLSFYVQESTYASEG
jgi:hypothetical protein